MRPDRRLLFECIRRARSFLVGSQSISTALSRANGMTSWGPNHLALFVRGTDLALHYKWWNGIKWCPGDKDWESLGGAIVYDPASVAWGPNRLDVFVIGINKRLYHKHWNGQAWSSGYTSLGGKWIDKPAVVSWGSDRLDVFLLGTDHNIFHKYWNGSSWNDNFDKLGGATFSHPPAAVSWGPNRIDIFGISTSSTILHKSFDGHEWSPKDTWETLGGGFSGPPKAVCWGPNRIDLFAKGRDSSSYHKWWDGSNWMPQSGTDDWETLGGMYKGNMEAVSWGNRRLDLFIVGMNNGVYHKSYDGAQGQSWHPTKTTWDNLGGTVVNDITAVCWGEKRIDAFVIGRNREIYHRSWDPSGGWQPSSSAYTSLGGATVGSVARSN